MTDRLNEWQQEAARRAEGAVVPVLMAGGAMEFHDWFGSVSIDHEFPLQQPDRLKYISSSDYEDDVIRAHMRQWVEWQRQHFNDLYIAFCHPEAEPSVLSSPQWAFVNGPFTAQQVDELLQGRRIPAVGHVPERFVAKTVRISALPGRRAATLVTPQQDQSKRTEPASDQPPDLSRAYWQWFCCCFIFLALLFFPFGVMEFSVGSVALVLVLAAGSAFINLLFRPEGPNDPNSSIMWPSGSPRRKVIVGLIVIAVWAVFIIVVLFVK